MALLDYPRHFVLLVGATAALALGLTVQAPWSPAAERLFVIFGLSGALHALALVLALRTTASWLSRAGFVVAAAAVSIAAALAGLGLAGVLQLNMALTVLLAWPSRRRSAPPGTGSWCEASGRRSSRAGACS